MIAVIDNYDSFVYNLVQYLQELGARVRVWRNDCISADGLTRLKPEALVISPGPGVPRDAGNCIDIIRRMTGRVPILGVCLGHQCIGAAFGGKIVSARRLMHGKVSMISHDGRTIYHGLENPFQAVRYHSLVISKKDFPDSLEVSANTKDGEIMGVRHKKFFVEGVQFHPESILTHEGMHLVKNFLQLCRGWRKNDDT